MVHIAVTALGISQRCPAACIYSDGQRWSHSAVHRAGKFRCEGVGYYYSDDDLSSSDEAAMLQGGQ